MDPIDHEKIWDRVYWTVTPWGQSGFGCHVISAIDLAIWDIKGQALGQPVWRLLGGARDRVEAYVTFGFSFLDREQLAEAARRMVAAGYRLMKMQVGRRDPGKSVAAVLAEDRARVEVVRDTVGPDIGIAIDAACQLDLESAVRLAQSVEELDIAFFEEPIIQNDIPLMVDMRGRTEIPIAAGQFEGLASRFRDMLLAGAVNMLQPSTIVGGGITQCVRIAGLAAAFNMPVHNGGGAPLHNMHLQAGVANGTDVENQLNSTTATCTIFIDPPTPEDGWLTLPTAPGLGLRPNRDAIKEYRQG
jgi:L-alanine-DL-glutamate epimerase-like enolase superfamily enzyme